ncbi:hypothetical protein KEM54_001149 [Ascosphaera aggregata]|nr:hypothetical protein KEM54_001149 [Ascosphaera aggregata]
MSFLKKPSWAATPGVPVKKDFYRRADIFYEDIIAREKEEEEEEEEEGKGVKEEKEKKKEEDEDEEEEKALKHSRARGKTSLSREAREYDDCDLHISYEFSGDRRSRSPSQSHSQSSTKRRRLSRSESRSQSRSPDQGMQPAFTFDPEGDEGDEDLDLESLKEKTKVANTELITPISRSGISEFESRDTGNDEGDRTSAIVAQTAAVIDIRSSPEIEVVSHTGAPSTLAAVATAEREEDEDDGFDSESDDEIREIMRAAREKARRARSAGSRGTNEAGEPAAPGLEDDRVIRIYLTSPIPDTAPLLVHRRISQNLGDVRKAWCGRQQFTPEETANIFLTWKDKRVFDVTTCRALGIKDEGVPRELLDEEGFMPDESVIYVHMIAYTPELWEAYIKKKRSYLEDDYESKEGEEEEEEEEDKEEEGEEISEPKMKQIDIRTPGMPTFTTKITDDTQVAIAIQAFKRARDLSETSKVTLYFDGDALQPEHDFQAYDIEDHDMIDARVQ